MSILVELSRKTEELCVCVYHEDQINCGVVITQSSPLKAFGGPCCIIDNEAVDRSYLGGVSNKLAACLCVGSYDHNSLYYIKIISIAPTDESFVLY